MRAKLHIGLNASVLSAFGAALLFGASTPFAKALLGVVPPVLLAGLLYAGSGIGLWSARIVRDRGVTALTFPLRLSSVPRSLSSR